MTQAGTGGTLILTAANGYTGATTISAGTLQIGDGGTTGSLSTSSSITDNGNLTFNRSNAVAQGVDFSPAAITGNGSLTQAGSATLTLNNVNGYNGGTTVSAGTLASATTGALGSGAVTLAGGTLRLSASTLSGFGGGVGASSLGWQINNTAITSNAFPSANVLQLTDGGVNEARTAIYSTPVGGVASGSNGFTATFTYTPSSGNLAAAADGVTFFLENAATNPTTQLGATGGNLGYGGITPSVALALNIFATAAGGVGSEIISNGTIGTNVSTSPVNLASGHPIQVTLSYNPANTTLTETLTDTTNTSLIYTTSTTAYNLATILGANSAYIGLSGGTGTSTSTQQISNFSYTLNGTATYANNLMLNGGATSTIDVGATSNTPTITMGTLAVGNGSGTQLNVTGSTVPSGQAYGLTLGATTLSGNVTFNVANNTNGGGHGLGTLTLGAVGQSGGSFGISTAGAGTVVLANAANTYGGATVVGDGTNPGTLQLGTAAITGSSGSNPTSNDVASSSSISIASRAVLNVASLQNGTFTLGSGSVAQTLSGPSFAATPISGGTVSGNLTLSGTGTGGGAITTSATTASAIPTTGTLQVTGTLTLLAGSTLNFTLPSSSNSNPLLNVSTLVPAGGSGTTTVSISNGSLGLGTYDLISYGNGPATAANFTLQGTHPGFVWSLSTTGTTNGQLDLTVSSPLTWTGHPGGSGTGAGLDVWDSTNNPATGGPFQNFANGPAASTYSDGSGVSFGNSNTAGSLAPDGKVYITPAGVNPSDVVFSNTFSIPYSINPGLDPNGTGAGTGAIGGSGGITVNGGGSVTFNTQNTYTGATTIYNGSMLIISADNRLGSTGTPGAIYLGGDASTSTDGGGGTLRVTGSGFTLTAGRGIALGPSTGSGSGTIDVANNNSNNAALTYGGVIANNGSGTGNLIVASFNGGGTLVLTARRTLTAAPPRSTPALTLQIGNNTATNSLPNGAGNTVTDNGSARVQPLRPARRSANVISGSTGSLTQQSANGSTLTLTPGSANTYGGGTIVVNGTLQLGNSNALPVGAPLTFGSTSVSTTSPTALDLNSFSATIGSVATPSGARRASSFQIVNSDDISNGNPINSLSTLTFAGSATGSSTFAGQFAENAVGFGSVGYAQIALNVAKGTLILTNGNNQMSSTTTVGGAGNAATLAVGNGSSGSATGTSLVNVNALGVLHQQRLGRHHRSGHKFCHLHGWVRQHQQRRHDLGHKRQHAHD